MTSEVEERIHKALASHPLTRIEDGYRLVHAGGAGISTLRFLPVGEAHAARGVVSIAEITAEYNAVGLPSFHAQGVQRLNSWSVHGAYQVKEGTLRQTAQFSLYSKEPEVHAAVQSILNAFGGQLPIGRSTALATVSPAVLKQQRAHHAMPSRWRVPLEEESLKAAAAIFQERGLAASHHATSIWAELALSGDCPSRAIDPQAETALLQVNTGVPHPIAGAGYLATVSLPLPQAPPNAAELCRRLNELELEQVDFAPRLGAWGLHAPNDMPGYSCFIPCAEPYAGWHITLMWWCVMRAAWLRDRFWAAGGLQLNTAGETKLS
ncbi:MAG: hypothetical protein NVS9B2_21070 [Steroidobacteraceae bacterium]